MPSVILQILFFFAAGASIFVILFVVSKDEKGEEFTGSSLQGARISTTVDTSRTLKRTVELASAVFKHLLQLFRNITRQPHEIFVYTRRVLGRLRGEKQQSVLNKTFEQDPEKNFSLQEVAHPAEAKKIPPWFTGNVKKIPRLAQKLHDQFAGRAQKEKGKGGENEEEFWLGILRQNPHVAHPYKKLGEIYLKRGDYKEAQASLAFALTKDPEDKEAAALLAEVKEKWGGEK